MSTSSDGYFIAQWESCSDKEKAEIISDFLMENDREIGWEGWQGFLFDRFCIVSSGRPAGKGTAGSS